MKLTIPAMAALLVAVLAACSGDDDQLVEFEGSPLKKEYTLSVETAKGIGAVVGDLQSQTRALTQNGSTLTASWATTDRVYVQKGGTWATGSLQPQYAGATSTLKGSLTGVTIAADDVLTLQFPKSGTPDYSGQKGTLEDIAANYDYATATANVRAVSANGMVAADAATFTNQQAIVKFTLKNTSDASINASVLSVQVDGNTYTVVPASAASEIYVAVPGFSSKKVELFAKVGTDWYSFDKSGITFTNGQYYTIAVKMEQTGTLPGKFSVSASKKVWFSQGNLKYTGSWAFHTNQYDMIGNSNGTDNRDLFGWGTGSNPNETRKDDSYYSTYSEWGTNMGSGWYTLTKDEWAYLFNTRASGSTANGTENARYTHATINTDGTGVNGMILFPDGVTIDASEATSWGTVNAPSTWDACTKCTTAQWTALEAKGCVFLPAAGLRYGTDVGYVGGFGHYWSSTARDVDLAFLVAFGNGFLLADNNGYRYDGLSVRLVRNAN